MTIGTVDGPLPLIKKLGGLLFVVLGRLGTAIGLKTGGVVPNRFEVDRSLVGILRRRMQFFVCYLWAKARSRTISKLLPIIEGHFKHPWVAGVELKIRFWPGSERSRARLWPWSKRPPGSSMHW